MLEIIPNWHPIFVHFTVALLSLAAGLFVVTPFVSSPLKEQWQIVSRWALWFGAGFAIVTGLTGLYAYNTVTHDTPSHLAMTDHRNWAIATIVLFLALASWSIVWARKNKPLGMAFVVCIAIAGAVLASTAWHGGEVVYRYGLGVMSLPKAEGDGHAHGVGNDHGAADQNAQESHGSHAISSDKGSAGSDVMSADDGQDHAH
ncbi:MAG: DUF2231 domain-containing protein [Gammaproteobacteria bacterium]|nr:DUF2231 domain-containing protein [Gammaproteobacteria bacterium]